MKGAEMTEERMAWWGTCSTCVTSVVVFPHDEADSETCSLVAEGPNEWDSFSDCYVCGGSIDWNGSDPVHDVVPRA